MKDPRYREFLRYVIPCVISMMSMAIFTMVDSVFVSRGVGSQALAGISVVYPVILLLNAFAAMVALGVSTMISARLALGRIGEANSALMSSVWLSLAFFILVSVPSMLFAEQIAGALGAEGIILKYGADYLRTYMYFALPSGSITILSAAVRNDGNPSIASVSLTASCILNIFADWLFVFPLKMEVVGAAIATGLSQIVGFLLLFDHFIRKKGSLRLTLRCRPKGVEMWDMVHRGFPEGINQLTTPITTVCYNLVLAKLLGDAGLEAYAVISQPVAVIIMLLLGVGDGTQPLFSHSHSVGDTDSNRYYLKKAVELNLILSVVVYAFFFFFGKTVFRIFSDDPALLEMALQGSRLYGINFLFSSVTMVISCYFMSIVETRRAVVINACRTFLFNAAFILLTPYVLGKGMIWAGIVFAELAVALVALALYRGFRRKDKAITAKRVL